MFQRAKARSTRRLWLTERSYNHLTVFDMNKKLFRISKDIKLKLTMYFN